MSLYTVFFNIVLGSSINIQLIRLVNLQASDMILDTNSVLGYILACWCKFLINIRSQFDINPHQLATELLTN